MNENKTKLGRRNFLIALGAGGAAWAAALAGKTAPRAQPASAQVKRRSKGYEATAHVRNYYRTAKV